MKLLVKYLKPFVLPALLCILLLFGQAMCDLTLPNMMSDIVNTGIQQGGIDEALPEVMNASGVELFAVFMDDEEEADLEGSAFAGLIFVHLCPSARRGAPKVFFFR